MRRLTILFLLASLSCAWAEETNPPSAEEKKIEQSPPTTPSAARPIPFQPSQEIGADSHISFPTDI